ncbi:ABC transporter ATP-binding protein [Desulfofustis limnaeus]|jgi:ABC-2 type transport system ATP-binding protein|uniref:ABC transporter ATP-binding protein n=1 Tax=Desulfofustis limnaeus TaxID=2740163 RepID=A0ABM7WEI7_9BACT|nr:ABC transporter ATP-binding protein [Desulfofustis limnaeus]MDX9895684.1 ABC transporter ATP-binding protein [Desulfofustis sp.]BDD89413.1 ABC transporter ATP-binding protein [Desulfofustis limnaeus]
MTILDVINLQKKYRSSLAVKDVSFQVETGSCFGLLGPNGAGKTTTMEIIEGIIEPTRGTILYKGRERALFFKEEIGIQFQHTSLLNLLSVRETLQCYRSLFRKRAPLERLIERCDLGPLLERRNNQLSGGQRQRLMLALALINQPQLVFLDEPSTGLDPQSRRYLWNIVKDIKKDGKTIIMTTHSMEEAEFLCDVVAIMDQGVIIAQDSPARLINTYCKTNTITLSHASVASQLDCLPMSFTVEAGGVTIQTEDVEAALGQLLSCNINLSEMAVHSANLEDVFLHLTGKTLRE